MRTPAFPAALALLAALPLTPAFAAPGDWSGPGWAGPGERGPGWSSPRWNRSPAADRSSEGRVDVSRFVAEGDAAKALGHGSVTIAQQAPLADSRRQATFEAAVIDRLAAAGYDTAARPEGAGQMVELRILRAEIRPEEKKRGPVSGEMTMGVGNRGSMMGMAVNVDLSKPLKALWSTRLEARIRDRASGAVLWEGHAEIATREGDERWGDQAVATKLAGALFDGFPRADSERPSLR